MAIDTSRKNLQEFAQELHTTIMKQVAAATSRALTCLDFKFSQEPLQGDKWRMGMNITVGTIPSHGGFDQNDYEITPASPNRRFSKLQPDLREPGKSLFLSGLFGHNPLLKSVTA
jgi:hypothetical protein